MDRGEFAEGFALADEALRIAETVGDPFSLILAIFGAGHLHLTQGELREAIPMLERRLAICHERDIPLLVVHVASRLGYAYALSGQVAGSLPLLEQAASPALVCYRPFSAAWLGQAYLLTGRRGDATECAAGALRLSRQLKQRGDEALCRRLQGEIAAQGGAPDAENAALHYREALALAEELGMRPLAAHCHLGLGNLYRMIGGHEQAQAELTTAAELYRAMGMTFWLARAEAELGQIASAPERM